jgi:hypothetical protein
MKVLCIDKGLGGGKHEYLKRKLGTENVILCNVPEPTETDMPLNETEHFKEGLNIIEEAIRTNNPTVLVASSRGGKYSMELLSTRKWAGPTVLISAMGTSKPWPTGVPIVMAYGTEEKTIPKHLIENQALTGTTELVHLEWYNDDHSLTVLTDAECEKNLEYLCRFAVDLDSKKEILTKVVHQKKKSAPVSMNSLFAEIQKRKQ